MKNTDKLYDVVIVGGGWAGATVAKKLGEAGKSVLIIEAGIPLESKNREVYMQTFFEAMAKVPSSPYAQNYNAPRPSVLDIKKIDDYTNDPHKSPIENIKKNGYFVEKGPLPFGSTNERVAGGTSWHWLGTCLRLVPNDFKLKTKYNVGVDWPMTYDDLSPYYDEAEYFIGVAGSIEQQDGIHGISFTKDYNYPMKPIPPSVLDQAFGNALDGEPLDENIIRVTGTPAGRNGISNRHWKTGKVYSNGRRLCQGNTNCTPICPIQAKYDATVTLSEALNTSNVDVIYQAVAFEVMMDKDSGEINGVKYRTYETKTGPPTGDFIAKGKKYVIAAHAIEAAKLLLMSDKQVHHGIANKSGQVGKNLMDHPMMVSWGRMPFKTYPFRGPLSTSGIETLKDGEYRKERAAYRIEIGNEGWNWPTGAPYTELTEMVDNNIFGEDLIAQIQSDFTREFRIGFLIEQDPEDKCFVVPSGDLKDHLGIPRPEIHYGLSEYTRKGFEKAREATDFIFGKLGAENFSAVTKDEIIALKQEASMFEYNGQYYHFYGAGHIMGTHRMGDDCKTSVTDSDMRSWDHKNLFLVGCGSFPTGATSNPTLTLVALALKATDALLKDLDKDHT